jgi:hypothetical protein
VQATNCASSFEVTTDGTGVVGLSWLERLRPVTETVSSRRHQLGRKQPERRVCYRRALNEPARSVAGSVA